MRPLDNGFIALCLRVDLYADFGLFESVIEEGYISLNIVVAIGHGVGRSMLVERVVVVGEVVVGGVLVGKVNIAK